MLSHRHAEVSVDAGKSNISYNDCLAVEINRCPK
jgi:hypothetical protein